MENVSTRESGNYAIGEYMINKLAGQDFGYKSVHAYTGKGPACVEVHVSKGKFTAADQPIIDELLNRFEFLPGRTPTSRDDFLLGGVLFMGKKYPAAARVYAHGVQLEKQQPQLDAVSWRVLVDNLGMAYGISHDLPHAREAFEYGVSKDPDYPMFYYNLGCTYAEMGDLDNTIAYLQKAFARRANVNKGEQMPDPRKDDSFQRFLSNPKFQEALAALPGS